MPRAGPVAMVERPLFIWWNHHYCIGWQNVQLQITMDIGINSSGSCSPMVSEIITIMPLLMELLPSWHNLRFLFVGVLFFKSSFISPDLRA